MDWSWVASCRNRGQPGLRFPKRKTRRPKLIWLRRRLDEKPTSERQAPPLLYTYEPGKPMRRIVGTCPCGRPGVGVGGAFQGGAFRGGMFQGGMFQGGIVAGRNVSGRGQAPPLHFQQEGE